MDLREETLARAFANALDAEDHAAAAGMLAQECVYEVRGETHRGPDAIAASYAAAAGRASALEGVRYESHVEAAADGAATVRFLDHLSHGGQSHTHSCLQRLTFAADGGIVRIVHIELPGESAALQAFFARAGVALHPPAPCGPLESSGRKAEENPMRLIDPLLAEMDQEAVVTRVMLGRAPREKADWKPHERSFTLAELCRHLASIPGNIASYLEQDALDLSAVGDSPEPDTSVDWVALHDENLEKAKGILGSKDNAWALSTWKVLKDGKELMILPRVAVVRGFLLNHWIHHRGQLSVYLRLLEVPVPAIFGPSADENPWA
ncbi:nuclear transport factor 2 family protein [bacterium]|nr:nuclear transport factor 2 family protein [bacterium]